MELTMQHVVTTVIIESVGAVEVSTINLAHSTRWAGYETCLFFPAGHKPGSQVVATYSTWQAAIEGHSTWANAESIARYLTGSVN